MELSRDLLELLRRPSTCYVATTMADGSPQLTQTWVDTDGRNVVINTVIGHQKVMNVQRDPRVALAVSSRDNPSQYYEVRGVVTDSTPAGAAEHIEALAQRYLGRPYPWFGGRGQQRCLLRISPAKVNVMG